MPYSTSPPNPMLLSQSERSSLFLRLNRCTTNSPKSVWALLKSRLGDSTSNRKMSQCAKKRNRSFSLVQNFIYNLLFDKVGICGFNIGICCNRHTHVLHCIVKDNILEYTIVGSLPNFGWTISDKFANFYRMEL